MALRRCAVCAWVGLGLLVLLVAPRQACAYASQQSCGSSSSWVAGQYYGEMSISSFSSGGCTLSISPSATTYTAGQTFTVTLKSSYNLGMKVVSIGGSLSGASYAGNQNGCCCIDYDGKQSSTSFTLTAPSVATQVRVKALCGQNYGPMLVASDIVIDPDPSVGTPAPTTSSSSGSTTSPPSSGSGSTVYGASQPLGGNAMSLAYGENSTHLNFKVTLTPAGYISFGPGSSMLGNYVVIGMDPSSNPGYSAVGVYKLQSKSGSNSNVSPMSANTPATMLSRFGIASASYAVVGNQAQLTFSILLSAQQSTFTLTGGSASAIYAGGNAAYGQHYYQGSLVANFASGATFVSTGYQVELTLAAHIFLMILAWELLLPSGVALVFLSRRGYGIPNWLQHHKRLQSVGAVFALIASLLGYLFVNSNGTVHWSSRHAQLGLFMLLMTILQPLAGLNRPSKLVVSPAGKQRRLFFNWAHFLVGYVIMGLGFLNCYFGVDSLTLLDSGSTYVILGFTDAPGNSGLLGKLIIGLNVVFGLVFALGLFSMMCCGEEGNDAAKARSEFMEKALPEITREMVARHNTPQSCWVIHGNYVIDVTHWLPKHPGGIRPLLNFAGKDITEMFENIGHSLVAVDTRQRLAIGRLPVNERPTSVPAPPGAPRFIDPITAQGYQVRSKYNAVEAPPKPTKYFVPGENPGARLAARPPLSASISTANPRFSPPADVFLNASAPQKMVQLEQKINLSHNVIKLTFRLPSASMVLGLPVGKHVTVFGMAPAPKTPGRWNNIRDEEAAIGGEIERKYTPISSDEDHGSFTLVIKVYRPCAAFPDGGKMGRYLDGLEVGDSVKVGGRPSGLYQYLGSGYFAFGDGRELCPGHLGLIAAGSGITPIFQILKAVLRDVTSRCTIGLLFANSTIDDIILRSEIDDLCRQYPSRFRAWFIVSHPPPENVQWKYSVGRVDTNLLRWCFPQPTGTLIVQCGPKPFMQTVAQGLSSFGFSNQQRLDYE